MPILSICLSSRGFGYALMEESGMLVDWGIKFAGRDKNVACMRHTESILARYQPHVMILEDVSAEGVRRAERIQTLTNRLVNLAKGRSLRLVLFPTERVMERVLGPRKGTKHDLAVEIADRFKGELGHRIPPKRKPWQSEDARLDMFKAVALGLHFLEYPQAPLAKTSGYC